MFESAKIFYNTKLCKIQEEEYENDIDRQSNLIELSILERADYLKDQIDAFADEMCSNLVRKTRKLKRYLYIHVH